MCIFVKNIIYLHGDLISSLEVSHVQDMFLFICRPRMVLNCLFVNRRRMFISPIAKKQL